MLSLRSFARPLLAAVLVLSAAPLAAAPPAKAAPGLPPLLDRELFFGNPEIAGAQLSPDGKWTAFLKPWKETRNVWVKRTGEPFEKAHLVTADPKRPIPGFFWTRDSRRILFVQDKDGDENYNVYAVDPSAKPEEGKDAPPARNLTEAKGVRAAIYAVPKSKPDVIYVGLNDRDAAWHDLYEVTISTGERKLLRKNTDKISAWIFDLAGNLRLAMRTADNGDTEILRVDETAFTKVYSCDVFESCGPHRFHKDGKRVYLETNKGDADLTKLVLFDPATGKEEFVESDPLKRVDFSQPVFSEKTDDLVATLYEDDKVRWYFRDPKLKADFAFLKQKFPRYEVTIASQTADDALFIVAAYSDTDPGESWLFDRKARKLVREYRVRERIPREHMAEMKPIRYRSSDGLEIPAYLTLPKGVPAKDLPLVVMPHGGPWARTSWSFANHAQFLANRGYAVLQPNFRGSTGYGKKFLNAGNNEWGQKMQDDLTWGVRHLVAKKIADPKRVAIMGGSYGGYATLAGVAFTPDLYAAGVSIVGPSNLLTLLETIPPYWEAVRIVFHNRMGDPTTPVGKHQLERQSPLNSADKIRTPLLVIQGANDPRVKKAESEQIVVALRDRGFPVEYICAPDEGHGFQRPVNNMALFAAAEKFLAKHVGGRFQDGGTPEAMARLAEITVDPKTVVLAKKVDTKTVVIPKPTGDLTEGTFRYAGRVVGGSTPMDLTMTRTVSAEGDHWVVTATSKLPTAGDAVDSTTYRKGTLTPLKRSIRQGPVSIDVSFEGTKATGTMAMGGEPRPFSIELGGEVFAEGSGSFESLARLPLAEGYEVVYRNLDVQRQRSALKKLKVLGSEEVSVAAGTFACWKAEVTSAEGDPGSTTFWVDRTSLRVVKVSSTLPQMGGATLTSELQP